MVDALRLTASTEFIQNSISYKKKQIKINFFKSKQRKQWQTQNISLLPLSLLPKSVVH